MAAFYGTVGGTGVAVSQTTTSSPLRAAHFTMIGWLVMITLALVAMSYKPARTAVLWILGLLIVGMIIMNSQNFKRLMIKK